MKIIGNKRGGKHLNTTPSRKSAEQEAPSTVDKKPIESISQAEQPIRVKPAEIREELPKESPAIKNEQSYAENPVEKVKKQREAKQKKKRKRRIRWLCTLLILAGAYFFFVYTQFQPIKDLRDAYIQTAMSTMSHQWLAEWFFPQSVIDEVMDRVNEAQRAQDGVNSKWAERNKNNKIEQQTDEEKFYALFRELDRESFEEYLSENPKLIKNGWNRIYINEAGLDDKGTSIKTTSGDTVLAIDAVNKIILIRVKGSGYQGVLAIAKDSSRLSCCAASSLGSYGQHLDDIAEKNKGTLALNGSGFLDEGGVGSGGQICGFAMCNGKEYGNHSSYGNKRIELHEDNLMYITDAYTETHPDTTDCVEFSPAIIVDGKVLINEYSGFSSINPRSCIGQNKEGEVMMLVIEGRLVGRSLGCGLVECAKILQRYDAYQIINLDGGTSAVMWYKGEYVTKCSNPQIQCRKLPNAWVYK